MFTEKLKDLLRLGKIEQKTALILQEFYRGYLKAAQKRCISEDPVKSILDKYLDLVLQNMSNPHQFLPYHKKITAPFDYFSFALNMMRPLVVKEQSKIFGMEQVDKMEQIVSKGDNVILLANHQTEPDPQIVNLLMEDTHKDFFSDLIFVAGDRVVMDPMAIPLSMGCNLLCIYSKKHIEAPIKKKQEKLLHNQRTMKILLELLSEGGKRIFVAPSGGRDRPNSYGSPDPARFDAQSVEMFYLIASKAKKISHFFPLSLYTYFLLPPPPSVEQEIGEWRRPAPGPAGLFFGQELDMEAAEKNSSDKEQQRAARAGAAWEIVRANYRKLVAEMQTS